MVVRFIGIFLCVCAFSQAHAGSLVETIKVIKASMVGVGAFDPLGKPQARLFGSGFAVHDGHYIATNFHVIDLVLKPKEEFVVFYGKGASPEILKVQVVATDRDHDLALLKLTGRTLPSLTLSADYTLKEEGTTIAFTGYPIGAVLGLNPVTHTGIVSSVTPIAIPAPTANKLSVTLLKRLKNPYEIYQLDATAYPGNSGSPVYLADTPEVIGIINKVYVKESKENLLRDPSAITYAIPAIYLDNLIQDYIAK
ncbi:MAG: trypsin-like peptidase domain-containing protein [Hahellaceae bacterium]|nr:trypsin-like peptidase domain-containing protein [Hahellaceae bacterium]